MKRHLIASAIMICLAIPAYAVDNYTIDPGSSIPAFEIPNVGFVTPINGHFKKVNGTVKLDFTKMSGSVDFTIYTESLDMGWKAWTQNLSDEGLFNVKNFPTITFKSDKLIFDGNKVVAAEGQFTLIGVTRPIKVAVSDFQCSSLAVNEKPLCMGNITATLKRSEFGLTQYIPEVSDEVKVNFQLKAYKD
jgi:polyisoprenoid-binding protein YceI